MAKRGKRMTRAEKVKKAKPGSNLPSVVPSVEIVAEPLSDEELTAQLLREALAANDRLKHLLVQSALKFSEASHDFAEAMREKSREVDGLSGELADLKSQAKARPFPTASNGKGGTRESNLVGTPVRVKGRIGLVTDVQKQLLLVALSDGCGGAIHRTFPVQQCNVVPLDDGTFEQLSQLPEHLLLSYGHCL